MKLKPMTYAATLLAALSLTGIASAQQGKRQGPPEGHRPPPQPLLKALDTDDDHKLSAEEISNASTALKTLDKDGDGKLSKEELAPKKPEGAPDAGGPPPSDSEGSSDSKPKHPPFPPSPVAKVIDADGDGEISADEIANASKALLTLDKDGDGALSQEELRPPHKGGNGGPPEGPPPAEGGESGGTTSSDTPASE
jgi:EF hand